MENAINSVVIFFNKIVSRDIKNYESREFFKRNYFFDVIYLVVSKI